MKESVRYIGGFNISVLHYVNETRHNYALLVYYWRASVFLCRVVLPFMPTTSSSAFDADVMFLLEEHKVSQ